MFQQAIHNVVGDVPFNAKKFPILIGIGEAFEATYKLFNPWYMCRTTSRKKMIL